MKGGYVVSMAASMLLALPVAATQPEIQRPPAAAQAVGVMHGVRTIPEACVALQGRFTGQADVPYALEPQRSSATCQPRARFVDARAARPSTDRGWKLNDRVQVPAQGCASQRAVVEVWRKPGAATPPKLDAQGRARLYLQDAKADAAKVANVTQYAATLRVEGKACGQSPG